MLELLGKSEKHEHLTFLTNLNFDFSQLWMIKSHWNGYIMLQYERFKVDKQLLNQNG